MATFDPIKVSLSAPATADQISALKAKFADWGGCDITENGNDLEINPTNANAKMMFGVEIKKQIKRTFKDVLNDVKGL